MYNKMDSYKEDLKQFMKTSSLKGLPKIVSAPNLFHRTLWIVAVIGLFVMCMWTVSSNLSSFLGYPSVTNIEERLIVFSDPNGTVPGPTIAVCNLNQFGSNKSVFEENGIPLPRDYHKKVHEMTECEYCNPELRSGVEFIKQNLMSMRGYYQYVGKEAMAKIGNQHFVLICKAIVSTGPTIVTFPCEDLATNYTFINPDVGLCTAYEAKRTSSLVVIGYTFTLHLDSSVDNLDTDFEPLVFSQPNSGAIVYAMNPYTTPTTFASTSLAGPGRNTLLYLSISRTDRLSLPYSAWDCVHPEEADKFLFQGRLYDYDFITCMGRCNVEHCEEKCNCTDLFMRSDPESEPPKYEYCSSVNQSVSDMFTKVFCSQSTKDDGYRKCKRKCKGACKVIKYTMRAAATKWPLPSQIGSFFANVIQNDSILSEKYKEFEDIAQRMVVGSKNVSHVDKLILSKAIEDNFALVSVYLSDTYYTHLESKPKTSIDALISQLGGSLNLWSGITVVLIVEIIDLILRLLGRMTQGSKVTPGMKDASVKVQDPTLTTVYKMDNMDTFKM